MDLPSTRTPGPDHAAARPEPVLDAAKLGGAVSAAIVGVGGLIVLIFTGVTVEDVSRWALAAGTAVTALASLGVYVAPVLSGLRARAKVTPLESPRNADGVPLMEVPGLSHGPRG